MKEECRKRLPEDMLAVLDRFDGLRAAANDESFHDPFLDGNEEIEAAIGKYYEEGSKDNLVAILEAIRQRLHARSEERRVGKECRL